MPEVDALPAETPWPAHLHVRALRWVRSSTHYDQTVAFYRDLVGFRVVGSFEGSFGEDGIIFGLPGTATHLEIVRSERSARSTDRFDRIVLYLPDDGALARAIEPLLAAGATPEPAPHPYWEANGGVVFLDPDGRGVVYAPWVFGSQPDPVDRTPGRATRPTPQRRNSPSRRARPRTTLAHSRHPRASRAGYVADFGPGTVVAGRRGRGCSPAAT